MSKLKFIAKIFITNRQIIINQQIPELYNVVGYSHKLNIMNSIQ